MVFAFSQLLVMVCFKVRVGLFALSGPTSQGASVTLVPSDLTAEVALRLHDEALRCSHRLRLSLVLPLLSLRALLETITIW